MFKKQQLPDANQYRYQFLYPDSSNTINTSTGTQSGSLMYLRTLEFKEASAGFNLFFYFISYFREV